MYRAKFPETITRLEYLSPVTWLANNHNPVGIYFPHQHLFSGQQAHAKNQEKRLVFLFYNTLQSKYIFGDKINPQKKKGESLPCWCMKTPNNNIVVFIQPPPPLYIYIYIYIYIYSCCCQYQYSLKGSYRKYS